MTSEPRYAIYFVPGAQTPLYRFGAAVLGHDCHTGRDMPLLEGLEPSPWLDYVREPRAYGFHATLKAPFRLAAETTESDLARAVLAFAADRVPVQGGRLVVRALGSFIALVPEVASAEVDNLAAACVEKFDRFRAPMNGAERTRRLESTLSARQIERLDRWGYPYVFEDFRFHMTLTGSLMPLVRDVTLQMLCDKFEQVPDAHTLALDRIVIARQAQKDVPFQVIREAMLGPAAIGAEACFA